MPTVELVVVDGVPLWEVRGHGVTVRHQQQPMARLQWHCQATARGYRGDPPVVQP